MGTDSNFLSRCPECNEAGKQNGTQQGFVTCTNDTCPISRIKIPLHAWQNWPRTQVRQIKQQLRQTTQQLTDESEQRRQEITRLQERLAEFGAIEHRNRELQREAADAKDRELRERQKASEQSNRIFRLEQRLKRAIVERDKLDLQMKQLTEWAVQGAKTAWAAENETSAVFFEEALDQLGKCNPLETPCAVCAQLPHQHQFPTKPMELSCDCSGIQYGLKEWTRRQRNIRAKKAEEARRLRFEKSLEERFERKVLKAQQTRYADASKLAEDILASSSFADPQTKLLAVQTKLLLEQTETLKTLKENK